MNNNKKSKINIIKNNLIKENKNLKLKIKDLILELKELKKIKEKNKIKNENNETNNENNKTNNENNKSLIIQEVKQLNDSCFKLPCIFIRFNERNIRLNINRKRSFGTTYVYSGFFDNYNIGLNSKTIINKKYKKFNFNVFFYFNKKDNHLYVSVEGAIRIEKNIIKYIFYTENNKKDFKKYKYTECETFNWPIIHNLKIKDVDLKEEEEVKIKIIKFNQIHKKKPKN